mmetsp:Transcript_20018/g.39697  ORF Transcript_20018/g.39697 Transcript_20018/m.39697 type:complete len:423 (+) Transcript_20018:75-1343(+)
MLPVPHILLCRFASTMTILILISSLFLLLPQQVPHAFVSAKVVDGSRGQDGTDVQHGREESLGRRQAVGLRPEGSGALEERGGHVSSRGISSKEEGRRRSVVVVVVVVCIVEEEDLISVSMAPCQSRHDVVLHFFERCRAVAASRDDFLEKEQGKTERRDDARTNGSHSLQMKPRMTMIRIPIIMTTLILILILIFIVLLVEWLVLRLQQVWQRHVLPNGSHTLITGVWIATSEKDVRGNRVGHHLRGIADVRANPTVIETVAIPARGVRLGRGRRRDVPFITPRATRMDRAGRVGCFLVGAKVGAVSLFVVVLFFRHGSLMVMVVVGTVLVMIRIPVVTVAVRTTKPTSLEFVNGLRTRRPHRFSNVVLVVIVIAVAITIMMVVVVVLVLLDDAAIVIRDERIDGRKEHCRSFSLWLPGCG